jgi:phage terminase large subunit-like protein
MTPGDRNRYYDRHQRDPRSKQFYNSADWKRVRDARLAQTPWCERCGDLAQHVHHKIAIATEAGWEKRLDPAGLQTLCIPCHNAAEHETEAPAIPSVSGILEPHEDDEFYFDEDAGERPIRFIEKFCRHHEGQWAGQRVQLLAWQQQLIRTLYGWKHREGENAGRRRFTEVFLLSGKGAGKTPLLSSIGQYEFFAGGEAAPHVVSMATHVEQAQLTQDWAKKSIEQDPKLSDLAEIKQFVIRGPRGGKWTTISGKFSGRAGFRPSCILADEAWEWPNGKAYESLTANLFKRQQPLLIIATNAGESRECFCWELYEQAKAVLAGLSKRKNLLPAIFEASEALDWTSEEAARAANPSIPEVITFEAIKPKIVAAQASPHAEAEYRRLHLSQWKKGGAKKWIDMQAFDACTLEAPIDAAELLEAPLYVGIDLSEVDDLCSAVFVSVLSDKLYVENLNWLPRETAEQYTARGIARYDRWEHDGQITLLEETTINPAVRLRIAEEIIHRTQGRTVKAVGYDAYRADAVIAKLTEAELPCVAIRQGFGVSGGCTELDRRLKEKSICFAPNGVMRLAAENVEVMQDQRGNIWPVKPNAKGRYAGTRSIKIDPIAALVTALVEARKHAFAAGEKQWDGFVVSA